MKDSINEPSARGAKNELAPSAVSVELQTISGLFRGVAANLPIVLGLFALGTVLRFLLLGKSDLWLDELNLFYDAAAGTNQIVSNAHRYHLAAMGWIVNNFGDSPFWIRSWAAIQGSIAVLVMTLAGLALGKNALEAKQAALVFGLLAALHPFLIYYSQDANYYGGMTLFASIQILGYILFFRGAMMVGFGAILAAGAVAHYNHPISSLFTGVVLGGCLLGPIVFSELRRLVFVFNPKALLKNPALPLLAVLAIVGFVVAREPILSIFEILNKRLDLGQAPADVEFSLAFFTRVVASYFGSFFGWHKPLTQLLSLIPFALFLGGIVFLASRTKQNTPNLAIAGLAVVAPLASFLAIFNLDHHSFSARYLTFLVPVIVTVIGAFALELSVTGSPKDKEPGESDDDAETDSALLPKGAVALVAAVLVVQVPLLAIYYASDRSNSKTALEVIAEIYDPGDEIIALDDNAKQQSRYYLPRMETGLEANQFRQWIRRRGYTETIASHTRYRLAGRNDAILFNSWQNDDPAMWDFLNGSAAVRFRGTSAQNPIFDARVIEWQAGQRMLYPSGASRFEDTQLSEKGMSLDWVVSPNSEYYISANGIEEPVSLTIVASEDMEEEQVVKIQPGNYPLESTQKFSTGDRRRIAAVLDPPVDLGTITVTPAMGDVFEISPFNTIDSPDDSRHKDTTWTDPSTGEEHPASFRAFDSVVNHLLWVPPYEERQLVIKAARRSAKTAGEAQRKKGQPGAGDLVFAVFCDGILQGMYALQQGPDELARIPTGIKFPAGNHRIDIYGFTPRLGGAHNGWHYLGAEFNRGYAETPLPNIRDQGVAFATDPEPLRLWGEPGALQASRQLFEASPSYQHYVSPDVVGPSGNPSYVVDLDKELKGPKEGYHFIFAGPPIPVQGSSVVGFKTYAKLVGTSSHAFQLAVGLVSSNGQLSPRIASQPLIRYPFAVGWRPFVEIMPIPNNIVAVVPGFIVFPPDPKKAQPKGKIYIDPISTLEFDGDSFADPLLAPGIVWDIESDE